MQIKKCIHWTSVLISNLIKLNLHWEFIFENERVCTAASMKTRTHTKRRQKRNRYVPFIKKEINVSSSKSRRRSTTLHEWIRIPPKRRVNSIPLQLLHYRRYSEISQTIITQVLVFNNQHKESKHSFLGRTMKMVR